MKLYQVVPPVTLRGEPAGPEGPSYLHFREGDFVVLAPKKDKQWNTEPGVVIAFPPLDPDFQQELDESSLKLVGTGLKLVKV